MPAAFGTRGDAMMGLPLPRDTGEFLFLGAHCDDVEIGCGGTLATLTRAFPQAQFRVVILSGEARRAAETRAAIAMLAAPGCNIEVEIQEFRDGFFPAAWPQIKESFENLKRRCRPDLIFTHQRDDAHQDHRIVCEFTWNTFRDQLVLEYEIPKWDGDMGRPGFFVPLAREVVDRKTATLLECFPSQAGKRWFTRDLFEALMRIRGMECNAESGFAEAFYARKIAAAW
jgi:LmbE family N-acetylglucosaminyl deacetylase